MRDDVDDWNEEIEEDLEKLDYRSLIVYSRDWTVETIVNQIQKGNIDLNPAFQRRNAWTDARRSRLIESLIINIPIPEIVLAEDLNEKNSFIVIDGKQRLLTIAGFIKPQGVNYWSKPVLQGLKVRNDLNGLSYNDIKSDETWAQEEKDFQNSDIRCTVISGYKDTDVLYDIFYRLNTGSVPLSTQELRQVLNKGPFADYLIEITNTKQPIHSVLNLIEPDKRLRDVELVLRHIAFSLFPERYDGNLKKFLDRTMKEVTDQWASYSQVVSKIYDDMNEAIDRLQRVFPDGKIGRKFSDAGYESRFNRALFEVQLYYFSKLPAARLKQANIRKFQRRFEKLSMNPTFRSSIEATTKSIENYNERFKLFADAMNASFGVRLKVPQFAARRR